MPEQYINDKGEVKDVTTMNSFELVNGLVKHAGLGKLEVDEQALFPQSRINTKLLKAELLERLDTRRTDAGRLSITVPLSEENLQDLQNGEDFDWTFVSQTGELVDVKVRPEVDEDNEA